MEDLPHLEFLATKSKEYIEKQISSYRQKHSNAGTIIGVTALFIPFFLNGLEGAYTWVRICSLVPIALLMATLFIMLNVLWAKQLDHGFNVDKFQELANKNHQEILVYEIGANTSSYKDNKIIVEKYDKRYNVGITLTIIAISIAAALLLTNTFFKPDTKAQPTEVKLIH